jgi:hypothetical protein
MNSPSSIFNFHSAAARQVGMIKRGRIRRLRALHVDARDDEDQNSKDIHCEADLQYTEHGAQNDFAIVDKETKEAASDVSVVRSQHHVAPKESLNQEIQLAQTEVNYRSGRRRRREACAKQSSSSTGLKLQSRLLEQIDAEITEIEAKLHSIHNMAATIIQTLFRARRAMRVVHRMKWILHVRREAASKIQSACRLYIAKQRYLRTQHWKVRARATIQIQSCYRGYIQRMKYHGMISAMLLHQRAADGVRIQQFCSDYSIKLRGCNQQMHNTREPDSESTPEQRQQCDNTLSIYPRKGTFLATKLQALCRGYATRQYRDQLAATKIQTQWRSYSCRSAYTLTKTDIIFTQSVIRRWLVAKQHEHNLPKVLRTHHSKTYKFELLENLATWCRDVSFEEEMNEIHLSFEEEMSELQVSLDEEVTRLRRRLSQVAAFELW